jgi:hypothetical protein
VTNAIITLPWHRTLYSYCMDMIKIMLNIWQDTVKNNTISHTSKIPTRWHWYSTLLFIITRSTCFGCITHPSSGAQYTAFTNIWGRQNSLCPSVVVAGSELKNHEMICCTTWFTLFTMICIQAPLETPTTNQSQCWTLICMEGKSYMYLNT